MLRIEKLDWFYFELNRLLPQKNITLPYWDIFYSFLCKIAREESFADLRGDVLPEQFGRKFDGLIYSILGYRTLFKLWNCVSSPAYYVSDLGKEFQNATKDYELKRDTFQSFKYAPLPNYEVPDEYILFAEQVCDSEILIQVSIPGQSINARIIELANKAKINLVYAENMFYSTLKRERKNSKYITYVPGLNQDLIKNAKAFVSVHSTAGMTAMSYGVPTYPITKNCDYACACEMFSGFETMTYACDEKLYDDFLSWYQNEYAIDLAAPKEAIWQRIRLQFEYYRYANKLYGLN